MYRGIIHQYSKYLPIQSDAIVTLNEGNTPLIESKHISDLVGAAVFLKYEGLNPTGSFKDRGMTYAVSKAKEKGAKAIICASTGNTSASAAAYAARAGMKCVVLIPEGNIAFGKLAQAMVHGAQVIQLKGNFDDALTMVKEIGKSFPIEIVNSINPYRLQGQKTGAFEVCDALNRAPDYHFIPVGNAGNITAYWMGYSQYFEEGKVSTKPRMMGFQAAGAAPIVLGKPVKKPETIATAIRIGNPASWKAAVQAKEDSKGAIDKVTDTEIVKAYKLLSQKEGVFCEPASAASVAGLIKYAQKNSLKNNEVIVCTLTGHGLKDPDTAIEKTSVKPQVVKVDIKQISKILKI